MVNGLDPDVDGRQRLKQMRKSKDMSRNYNCRWNREAVFGASVIDLFSWTSLRFMGQLILNKIRRSTETHR